MNARTVIGFVWDHAREQYRRNICVLARVPLPLAALPWRNLSDADKEKLRAKLREALALREADELNGRAA